MSIYQQLTDQAERVVRARLRRFCVYGALMLLAYGGAVGWVLYGLLGGAGIPPLWLAVGAAALVLAGVLLGKAAHRISALPRPDCLKAHMESLITQAEMADFAMRAPDLYSPEAFARIADEDLLAGLAFRATCAGVRREAVLRLQSPDARLRVASAATDEAVALLALGSLDPTRLAAAADASPLRKVRLAAAKAAGDGARILREVDNALPREQLAEIIGLLTAPDDLATAAARVADDALCLQTAERCVFADLAPEPARALAGRLHAILTRPAPRRNDLLAAARLLKAMYRAGGRAREAAGGYAGTRGHAHYEVQDTGVHTDSHADETENCHSVDDYCGGPHTDSHTDEYGVKPAHEDIILTL